MKLLAILFHRAPATILVAILAGIVSGATSTSLLILLNKAIFEEGAFSGRLIWVFFGLCVLAPTATVTTTWFFQRLGQGEVAKLRVDLSRQILATPLRKLEDLGAPRLLSVLTDDTNAAAGAMILLPQIIIFTAIVLGCLIYLGWLSLTLFWVVMAFFVLGVLSYQLPILRAYRLFIQARDLEDHLFRHFRGLTEGTKELVINRRRRSAFLGSLEENVDERKGLLIAANLIAGSAAAWGQLLIFVVVGGLLVVAPRLGIEHAQVARNALVLIYMMTPLQMVLNAVPQLGMGNAAIGKIHALGLSLRGGQAAETGEIAPLSAAPWSELCLDGVAYTYPVRTGEEHYEFHLGPLDLRFRRGELVFLVGGNGSGKTSLAKLLLGLYTPEKGQIFLDGCEVNDENRDAYQGCFSTVFSDFFLFEELFGIGRESLDETAQGYLRKLDLEHKVRLEDGKLSTISLSQGQRKRLALLVAYLEDRDIYLFDEWAADQDPFFKQVFYEVLLPELKERGKTIFVISHDDHFYRIADRIIKMDNGQIEFDGGFAELVSFVAKA